MESSDKSAFVEVLAGLAAIWRVDLTKEVIQLWWRSMRDWPIDDFKDAAGYLVRNCQFMPAPYDFEQLRKKGEKSAHEAWSLALIHAEGAWRYGVLGDARIDQVVAMLGGYGVIALTSTYKLGFLERRFMDAYKDLSDSRGVREALPNLTKQPQPQNGTPIPKRAIKKA